MSIAPVEREINRFLVTKDPEVICFSGHWGVGKTFAWNRFFKEAREKRLIALSNCSYVSLLGVNSLEELKYSIFENSVQSSAAGLETSLETLKSNTTAIVKQFGKKSLGLLGRLPKVKSYIVLKSRVAHLLRKKKEPVPENEVVWNVLLDSYDFISFDEFDLALLKGIEKGFFAPVTIDEKGSKLDARVKDEKASGSFQKAWGIFHESFADNHKEVLDTIYQAALAHIQDMSAVDLDRTVWLMKGLGRPERAAEVIDLYIAARSGDRQSFDLENHPFRGFIRDADIIAAFNDKYAQFKDERGRDSILLSIAKTHGWNEMDIGSLSALSSDELYNVFKNLEGPDLRKIVNACLEFGGFGAASQYMEISKRAKEALHRLAGESTLNALRVGAYSGVRK